MRTLYFTLLLIFFNSSLFAQSNTLIKNVHVWDGTSNQLNKNMDVLIEGNRIKKVAKNILEPNSALVIDGSGKTLIPGLSDVHVHLALTMGMDEIRNDAHWMYN